MPQRIWNNSQSLYIEELNEVGRIVSVCRVDLAEHIEDLRKALREWDGEHPAVPANGLLNTWDRRRRKITLID